MPDTVKPIDKIQELADKLFKFGLRDALVKAVGDNIALDSIGELLALSQATQQKALEAALSKSDRSMAEFVKALAKELRDAEEVEFDTEPENPYGLRPDGDADKKTWRPPSPESSPDARSGPTPGRGSKPPGGGPKPPIPRSAKQYYYYLNDFITKNLGPFGFDEETQRRLANNAAKVAEQIKNEYGLPEYQVPKVALMSLYDIFIVCDNSGSMRYGQRIDSMNKTLQSVAHWATKIDKEGISLRFLNRVQEDDRFDKITDPAAIDNIILKIPIGGGTKLGTVLRTKVLKPLEDRVKARKEKGEPMKPRIILLITDGEPKGEHRNCLGESILSAKDPTTPLGSFGKAGTIFIITRVGDSEDAGDFLNMLAEDEEIGGAVLTYKKRLEEVRNGFMEEVGLGDHEKEKEKGAYGYRRFLLQLFIEALDGQTNTS